MRLARELIVGCHERMQTVAQRAMSLNTQGMIDMALGDYGQAEQHLEEAAAAADGFGRALTSHIEDNLAFLRASNGEFNDALGRLRGLQEELDTLDPTHLCSVLTHEGTALRRSGDAKGGLHPTQLAIETVTRERDPYLAYNAQVNLALSRGLLGVEQRSALQRLSARAAVAGISFVELKALLFEAVLAHAAGDSKKAVEQLEQCLSRQLALGHINLIAQELCPRPDLAALVLRRHRSNGLGPSLVNALSRHWQFAEVAPALAELCPSQTRTWIQHVGMGRSPAATNDTHTGRRRQRAASSCTTSLGDLTPREREVLQLMAEDRSNEQIAGDLFISIPTVKTHVNHILRKLGQKKRVGAVLEYQRLAGPAQGRHARRDRPHLNPPR
jgi:DNA-binding CsgD family transcriptional regulator/tetratricopeptide (TPR) repeat protein